jgi:Zn-dependent alcohol dehydrogenase
VRLDDKKFAVTGLATVRADTLPSASATRNDICLLQKAANGKKLSLTEASIWRIWAECIGIVHTMRQALECCHRGWGESVTTPWPHRVRRFRPARFSS